VRSRRHPQSNGIDSADGGYDAFAMARSITIKARWDSEAGVWIATSGDVHGLVVEAETWPAMIREVRLILPDLLELLGYPAEALSVTFIAEERLDLALA
jgi:hypothetical protein